MRVRLLKLRPGERTPGPAPAMMAMGLDIADNWEVRANRRLVGCM